MAKRHAQGRLGVIKLLVDNIEFREWINIKINAVEGARAERALYGASPHAKIFLETVGIGLGIVRSSTHATREEMLAAEKLLKLEHEGGSSTRLRKR